MAIPSAGLTRKAASESIPCKSFKFLVEVDDRQTGGQIAPASFDMSVIPILFGVQGADHLLLELKPKPVSGWFQGEIYVRCGPWSGHCAGRFLAGELHKFGQGINEVYSNLRCTALLRPIEHYLVMSLNSDGHGHVQVSGVARHELESKLKLEFDFVMDQEDLEPAGRALLAADRVHV